MEVIVNRRRFTYIVDALLERKRADIFPYNVKGVSVPQLLIPDELRENARVLALFYFFVCIYMRGGIKSHTAFKQLIKLWKDYPHYFEPAEVIKIPTEDVQEMLKKYVGWDSKVAGRFWKVNAKRMDLHWGSNPFEIIKGTRSYDEAVRRIANNDKKSKKERNNSLDLKNQGFIGFQHKMASMLLYFYDWEGWITSFLYPSPADFHHYRIFIANEAISILDPTNGCIRYHNKISESIRTELMHYMKTHNTTPVELGDAIWLYSLAVCGESPATVTKDSVISSLPLFVAGEIKSTFDTPIWTQRQKKKLLRTCGICVLRETCTYAIPSNPYYKKGLIELRTRTPVPCISIPDVLISKQSESTEQDQLPMLFPPDE